MGIHRWKRVFTIAIEFCIFELVYVPNFTLNKHYLILRPNLPKKGISGRNHKTEHHHWILHIRIHKVSNLSFTWQFCFLNQICPKRVFTVENGKIEHHHWMLHTRVSLGTKFHFNQTILILMPNLPKNGISKRKQKTDRHYWILHIQISLSNKFQVKLVILIFRPNFLKKGISGWKWKKWAWPLDSAYSSYAKYQISASAANFDFLDQICPKGYFQSKTRKVNVTIEFYIFYLA